MKKIISMFSLILMVSIPGIKNAQGQAVSTHEGYMSNSITSSLNINQLPVDTKFNFSTKILDWSEVVQDTTLTYQIITNDGNEFIGTIIEQDAQKIVIKTINPFISQI